MKSKHLKCICLLFSFAHASLAASSWVQGGFLIHEAVGGVDVSELGQGVLDLEPLDLPVGVGGRFLCRTDTGASVFLSASNRVFIQLRGAGEMGVERFEQTRPEAATWSSGDRESGRSRMLFSFRFGHLLMDARGLSEVSRVAVETPLGQISGSRALWEMRVDFDQRSGIFNFEIACSEGRLSFVDKRGLSYALRAGQRLSGAGGWTNPGIEIVEMTTSGRESIEEFLEQRGNVQAEADRLESFLPLIGRSLSAVSPSLETPLTTEERGGTRPVIIEYAPRPKSLTPFRGEMPAPEAR